MLDVKPGSRPRTCIALRVDPSGEYDGCASAPSYLDGLVRTVSAVPGVAGARLTDALPFGDTFGWRRRGARRWTRTGPNAGSRRTARAHDRRELLGTHADPTPRRPERLPRPTSGQRTGHDDGNETLADAALAGKGPDRPVCIFERHSSPRDRRGRRCTVFRARPRCRRGDVLSDRSTRCDYQLGGSGGPQGRSPSLAGLTAARSRRTSGGRPEFTGCATSARCRSW